MIRYAYIPNMFVILKGSFIIKTITNINNIKELYIINYSIIIN